MNLNKGLVGHWTLDDIDTDGSVVRDRSTRDNHADIESGVETSHESIIGESYNIPGDGDTVITGYRASEEVASLSLWIKPLESGTFLTGTNDGNDRRLYVGVDSGYDGYYGFGDEFEDEVEAPIESDEWNHLIMVGDGSTATLYVNGESTHSFSYSWGGGESEDDWTIGSISGSFTSNGRISDVRIYERALSDQEINALYNMRSQRQVNSKTVNTEDLILHLNARNRRSVDEENSRWHDISGNDYVAHGTSGEGEVDDSLFPDWSPENGGRFILTGSEAWNVPGPIETTGQVSYEIWFYRSDLSSSNNYLSDARNGDGSWHLTNYRGYNISYSADLQANDPAGTDYREDDSTASAESNWFDRWTHIVATSDGDTSQLFIDGERIDDDRLRNDSGFPTGIGQDFAIATRHTGTDELEGYMSVFRVYDKILSPAQVLANYNAEKMYYK